MLRLFPVTAGLTLALGGAATLLWANPYQSRLDREYKSLSQSIARAYSPPPPPPPPRSYSTPMSGYQPTPSRSYSSSSSRSSFDYSSPSGGGGAFASYESLSVKLNEIRRQEEAAEKRYQAARAERAKAEARERFRRQPIKPAAEWAAFLAEAQGKAPLAAPPNAAMESRRSEFAHYAPIAAARGAQAPWENLRAGQHCLLLQGVGAEPGRALQFFLQSNPAWPEVQLGLGLCYLRGFGTAADPVKARAHLEQAATHVPSAGTRVSFIGTGELFPDPAFQAGRELALAFDFGRGLPADPARALEWYDKAAAQPLTDRDRAAVRTLRQDFWQRHATQSRALIEREFAAARAGGADAAAAPESALGALVAARDAQALFDLGEFADTKPGPGRNGSSYFLAAAQLGHEPAARAYFSPAKNGAFNRDLDGAPFWREHAEFVREQWPAWEEKFLAAVATGDASAHVPLAFHYSGARGQTADPARAKRHADLLPATLPAAQRSAILRASAISDRAERDAWLATVWSALGGDFKTVDLRKPARPADPARGAALRDEGIALAATDLKSARDRFRDAAALGDLPAQVQLWFYAQRHGFFLGNYYKSLQPRLEAAAAGGDVGAMAALASLMDGSRLGFDSGRSDLGAEWRTQALAHAPHQAAYLRVAEEPLLSDEHCSRLRAAAVAETAQWRAVAKKWGLEGFRIIDELTLSAAELQRVDGLRAQFVALAAASRQIATQLALWENTIEPVEFDAESEARFLLGLEAWQGPPDARDAVLAVDYLAQSAGLGHPMAPLALAYFFGSGFAGFPRDAAVERRCRALGEARLTTLAEAGDLWAQTMLGTMLVDPHSPRESDGPYDWLPVDVERGLKWLKTAAVAGGTLLPISGDTQGRTIAWYLSGWYRTDETLAVSSQWNLIDELLSWELSLRPPTGPEWENTLARIRAVLAEDAETSRARAAIDRAVDEARKLEEADIVAARQRRIAAREAAQLGHLALIDATEIAYLTPASPIGWHHLARLQTADGQSARAALSLSLAQALEKYPGAPARFSTALAQADADAQEMAHTLIGVALNDDPQSAVLKDLKARADKFAPAR
jgi:hypothetical protein